MTPSRPVPAVRACRRCDEPRFRVVADGEDLGGACWAAIFNVSRYGHGLRLCPSARPDDGFLQLLLLRDPVGPRLPRVLLAGLRGRLHLLPDASLRPVRRVLLEEVHCSQVDGDVFAARELDVRVLPGSLRVHAPP